MGYLTAVSPASATIFSLLLLPLKSKIRKPIMMMLASLLYASLCVFMYLSTTESLQKLGWKICILYFLGTCVSSYCTSLRHNVYLTNSQVELVVQCLRAQTKQFLPTHSLCKKKQRLQQQLPPAAEVQHWLFLCFHIWRREEWC